VALLSTEKFIELYKSYKGEVTDIEFAEFLNSIEQHRTPNLMIKAFEKEELITT